MTIPASVMAKMATLGLSAEHADAVAGMLAAVEEATAAQYEAAAEVSKAKGRERWRRWKDNQPLANVSKHLPTTANHSRGGDAPVEDKTSNLDIEPQKKEQKEGALSREFASFWVEYPNKVGKPKARDAFTKARKIASLEAILSGLTRYIGAKPADRAWLNPASFLNQERWDDQPAAVVPTARGSPLQRPMTAQEILKARRQEPDHDERPPIRPLLVASR